MKRCLVSVVSKQTLPNYLLIKELEESTDRFLFISSKKMEREKKTADLAVTAGIPKDKMLKVLIEEDQYFRAHERLDKLHLPADTEYIVNLTGGTKLMAIAVREYFERFPNVRFFYVPLDKNTYKEIHDDRLADERPFTYRISVAEYLSIYGMRGEPSERLFNERQVLELYKDVRSTGYELERFPLKKLKKYIPPYKITKQMYTKWFEEYLYYRIKGILRLEDRFIATGLKLYSKLPLAPGENRSSHQNDNEVDIFFLYKNRPYIVENKFSLGKREVNIDALVHALFKMSGVNRRFGLNVYATLATLSDLDELTPDARRHLRHRCRILGLHYPIDRNDIHYRFGERLRDFIQKREVVES
ncbi:MAG: DUF1887 family protein [Chlorobi bacterium]|nr:DUF1887 family protein [Chlorobiota bacterium]